MPSQRIRLLRATPRGAEVMMDMTTGSALSEASEPDQSAIDTALEETADLVASLLRDAEGEAIAIRQRAYIEGRAEGEGAGLAAGRADVVAELQLLQSVGLQAASLRESILRNSESELIELTAEAARAVLGEAIDRDPELVTISVQRALNRAMGMNILRVRVNPDDASVVSAYLSNAPMPSGGTWEISPDGAITVGGCIIDIEGGEVDARLDVQFDAVFGALRELVPHPFVTPRDEEQLRAA